MNPLLGHCNVHEVGAAYYMRLVRLCLREFLLLVEFPPLPCIVEQGRQTDYSRRSTTASL